MPEYQIYLQVATNSEYLTTYPDKINPKNTYC